MEFWNGGILKFWAESLTIWQRDLRGRDGETGGNNDV
jgi:hypothetical protein